MTPSVKFPCAATYQFLADTVLGKNGSVKSFSPVLGRLAKANYLLLALWRSQEKWDGADVVWTKQVALLTRLEAETAAAVSQIMPQFVAAGLPLLAIKSFLPFPYVDSNLDLVTVKPGRLPEYVELLHRLGYRRYRNLADLREPMKQTYQTEGVTLRLHLHTAVSWNGVVYLPLAQLWQHRRKWAVDSDHVWISAAEDELLIMAAHALFENKMVSLHEILYWYRLVTSGLDWDYIRQTAQTAGWYLGLQQFLAIMIQLANLLNISVDLPLALPVVSLRTPVWLPYIFPFVQNWRVTGHKLAEDLRQGRWRGFPRQLFSYLLVDHFWMYRKAYRKRREVTAVCS